jgi:hypothetical protein
VEQFFEDSPSASITDAIKDLGLSCGNIWQILCLNLHWYPYKLHMTNQLTPNNRVNRETFCRWILAKPDVNTFLQKVIWRDEKWFVLHPKPNRQNTRIWAPFNPMEEVACRYQGDSKVMAWVALVDGKALQVQWMQDHEGRNVNVSGESYLKMVRDKVWPEVRLRARRLKWWFQQDGAPVHVTRATIDFIEGAFQGRATATSTGLRILQI